MDELQERRWIRRHAMFAPFGIAATTALLLYLTGKAQWNNGESLELLSSLVDLGAVLYAMAAVLVERGIRMWFWALDERRKWREKWRTEARAEGLAEGRVEGLAEGRVEGLAEGRVEGLAEGLAEGRAEGRATAEREFEEWLERVSREKGIALEDLPPR